MAKGAGVSAEKVVKDIRRKTHRRFSAVRYSLRSSNSSLTWPATRARASTAFPCRADAPICGVTSRAGTLPGPPWRPLGEHGDQVRMRILLGVHASTHERARHLAPPLWYDFAHSEALRA